MEWKNIYRGLLMGAVEVIPGISGGTLALLLGIYKQLIEAINGFFSRKWKRYLGFLIPLGVGMVIAIFTIANVIEWLFIMHPQPTQYFFLGLIVGILPFLYYKADGKNTFQMKHLAFLIVGVVLVSLLGLLNEGNAQIITNVTITTYVFLFFSGIIGSSGLLLPGVSGSFLLLVLGAYPTVIAAVSNFHLDIIFVTGLGIVIGFILISRVLGYFLRNHFTLTLATAIGLVLGSVFVIFPGWPVSLGEWISCIFALLIGLITAYILGRFEYK